MATPTSATRATAPAAKPASPSPAKAGAAPVSEVAPGILELKGMTDFKPAAPIAEFLDARKKASVNVRFGNLAQGQVKVTTAKKGHYRIREQPLALTHPLLVRAAEALPDLTPCLVIKVERDKLGGHIGLAAGEKVVSINSRLQKTPELIGLFGFKINSLPTLTNKLEDGSLRFGLTNVPVRLGSAFSGKFSVEAIDETVSLYGDAEIIVGGLAKGTLALNRTAEGLVAGKVDLGLNLPKNITGSFTFIWDGRVASGEGKLGYSGEKLSGSVVFRLMEKREAEQLETAKKAPEGAPEPPAVAKSKNPPARIDYVIFGEGNLVYAFNDWLRGNAQVIINPKGYLTVIGKITPQKEFLLFPQKDYVKNLFKVEARASYGIPVVGNIFIFANVGLDAFANIGKAVFRDIVVDGTYSTDPKQVNSLIISGTFNISAAAGLRLRAEAGAGLEILDHEIKIGAGLTGTAGIKAYVEVKPIIGYREKITNGEDKKGEFFVRGEAEIAAQPFLGLKGDAFVAVETPWWSPISDKRWTWPLFDKEWPLGGSLGAAASIDYVFGSGQWPKLDLKPAEFSPDKFMTTLYDGDLPSGSGKEAQQKGKWKEKNSAAAQPPPQASPKGNATPGKLPPSSTPKAKPGTKKSGKPAAPGDRTKEGKSVQQLQEEAVKKGKKPKGADPKGAVGTPGKQDASKTTHDEELKKGLAALQAVTDRYAKDGATKEDVVTGVKSVRRKFKVFKSLEVIDGGATWDYDYTASPGNKLKGAKKASKPTYGTLTDPIPLAWPGPPTSEYPKMYFGGRLAPADRPKKQSVLRGLHTKGLNVEGEPVEEYSPHGHKTLPGETRPIGLGLNVGTHEIGRISVGKIVGPLSHDTTPGGSKLGNIIDKYGFSSTEDGMQLDHVHETQFGGIPQNDRVENLWPLASSMNSSKGASLRAAPVEFPKGTMTTISHLKTQIAPNRPFWFKVKSVL
jgi:hypothetical protein